MYGFKPVEKHEATGRKPAEKMFVSIYKNGTVTPSSALKRAIKKTGLTKYQLLFDEKRSRVGVRLLNGNIRSVPKNTVRGIPKSMILSMGQLKLKPARQVPVKMADFEKSDFGFIFKTA